MAPWPSRILSPTARNFPESSSNAGPSAGSPAHPRGRVTEADILENAYGIPTLPGPRATKKPSHGRSMSHPFPSLFAGKKKKPAEVLDSTDEEGGVSPSLARQTAVNPTAKQKKMPDKELMVGPCMTCDSVVRWPRDLKVFRCTVCMTINDLKPILLETQRGDGTRGPVKLKAGQSGSRFVPLSVEKTRALVDQCITSYLMRRLRHESLDAEDAPVSPQPRETSTSTAQDIPFHKLSVHGAEAPLDTPPTPLIHLTEYPFPQENESSQSRPLAPPDFTRSHSIPYSSSLPGNIFGMQHSEQKGQDYHPAQAKSRNISPVGDAQVDGPKEEDSTSEVKRKEAIRRIFRPVEDYIAESFGSFECINSSFSTARPIPSPNLGTEGPRRNVPVKASEKLPQSTETMSELDAKTLLLGNFAENGLWWTGESTDMRSSARGRSNRSGDQPDGSVTLKSPQIDWPTMNEWYHTVIKPGRSWQDKLEDLTSSELLQSNASGDLDLDDIEAEILEAQVHLHRVLLKVTESLLKRPGRPLREPEHLRFLLIILANPLIYPSHIAFAAKDQRNARSKSRERRPARVFGIGKYEKRTHSPKQPITTAARGNSGQHSGIIKRILGLLSGVPNECHHYLVSWLARYPEGQFQKITDLIGSFVTYRLVRQHGKKREVPLDPTAGLVPSLTSHGRNTSAALHAALGVATQQPKKKSTKPQAVIYTDDWQIKAAARVMAVLFSANNSGLSRKGDPQSIVDTEPGSSSLAHQRALNHGQIVATSDFYNTLLDYSDLIADFEAWEAKRSKFVFCQYPFFLSIWAKIQIMEYDARRQMEIKARDAYFDNIIMRQNVSQYLTLKIRRQCLVEDSLRGVSEVVGSNSEDIKKGLRIEFKGEEGIDAGGLRKEWFLLLVREVFNPEHGMFTYDEDSHFCYFNPFSFETTDQFFLVGIVLGLAIYNSTILDVALPPFAFRKLLASWHVGTQGAISTPKPAMTCTLEDLAEYRPSLAAGLRQLLDFDGDVESTYCRDFVADVERYGQIVQIPLCPDGEKKPVTNANRREFVDLYVRYLLDTAVSRQFEPFKRGFFSVCGGNALSLFRPEEIELLIRGSDEPLDIHSLQVVSTYANWGSATAHESEPVVQWFWESFCAAEAKDQRKLLTFITGSDRIPAMGATNLIIKITCMGDDSMRFPSARTCFNTLGLYRYENRGKLERLLWRAVAESEGFGLK